MKVVIKESPCLCMCMSFDTCHLFFFYKEKTKRYGVGDNKTFMEFFFYNIPF